MKKSNSFSFVLGFGLIVLMIALSQSAKAQTPFTQEEINLLRNEAPEGDERLVDNNGRTLYCVFDNDGDGLPDTSFNMKMACGTAFERALSPEVMSREEMHAVMMAGGYSQLHITSSAWTWTPKKH